MTHYEILGVPQNETTAYIINAYNREIQKIEMAIAQHQHQHQHQHQPEIIAAHRAHRIAMNEAVKTLTDPEKRHQYDRELQSNQPSQTGVSEIPEQEYKKPQHLQRTPCEAVRVISQASLDSLGGTIAIEQCLNQTVGPNVFTTSWTLAPAIADGKTRLKCWILRIHEIDGTQHDTDRNIIKPKLILFLENLDTLFQALTHEDRNDRNGYLTLPSIYKSTQDFHRYYYDCCNLVNEITNIQEIFWNHLNSPLYSRTALQIEREILIKAGQNPVSENDLKLSVITAIKQAKSECYVFETPLQMLRKKYHRILVHTDPGNRSLFFYANDSSTIFPEYKLTERAELTAFIDELKKMALCFFIENPFRVAYPEAMSSPGCTLKGMHPALLVGSLKPIERCIAYANMLGLPEEAIIPNLHSDRVPTNALEKKPNRVETKRTWQEMNFSFFFKVDPEEERLKALLENVRAIVQ